MKRKQLNKVDRQTEEIIYEFEADSIEDALNRAKSIFLKGLEDGSIAIEDLEKVELSVKLKNMSEKTLEPTSPSSNGDKWDLGESLVIEDLPRCLPDKHIDGLTFTFVSLGDLICSGISDDSQELSDDGQ